MAVMQVIRLKRSTTICLLPLPGLCLYFKRNTLYVTGILLDFLVCFLAKVKSVARH